VRVCVCGIERLDLILVVMGRRPQFWWWRQSGRCQGDVYGDGACWGSVGRDRGAQSPWKAQQKQKAQGSSKPREKATPSRSPASAPSNFLFGGHLHDLYIHSLLYYLHVRTAAGLLVCQRLAPSLLSSMVAFERRQKPRLLNGRPPAPMPGGGAWMEGWPFERLWRRLCCCCVLRRWMAA